MKQDELFILAEQTFADKVALLTPALLAAPIPEWFELGRSGDRATLRVRDVLNYHAYDTAWVPDTYAGKTIDEVGSVHDGDLLGNDPLGAYKKYSDAAVAAIRDNYDPDRTVHYSYGDYPASEALEHITAFRTFRAYDFARLTGADRALPSELIDGVRAQITPHIDEWRQIGVFKPALPVADDADTQAKLFALVGRDPDWRA